MQLGLMLLITFTQASCAHVHEDPAACIYAERAQLIEVATMANKSVLLATLVGHATQF